MDNNNTYLAPVIYVAESPEQSINYKWDSKSHKLNPNVEVLEPQEILALANGKKHFYLPYDITPGEILVRHPYNQGYILSTEAENEYLTASAEGFFLISRCLGATKIIYKKCNIAEFKRELDVTAGLKYKAIELNLSAKNSMEQKLLGRISMTREFPNQEFTMEKFKKAESVASERGLLLSSDIRSLLDARNPEFGAPMTHETVKIEITSSLNKAMDIAFTLNSVPLFNINANARIATEKKLELCIEWEIQF